jgi:nicotinamide-nucleotide adenylyltransferase
MASKLPAIRQLVTELGTALKDFQNSASRFRLLKTINPSSSTPQNPASLLKEESPQTLFILDSSFNPPSIAHQSLAQSALRKTECQTFPAPYRLLLLFATMNADKAPSAASFDQRLTLMTIFAKDLIDSLEQNADGYNVVPVDIGITTVPYYTDKSAAIENEGQIWYPGSPKHVHLVGFDTLTRFFTAKYYKDFDPPFSALNPYFDTGHRLRVTLRPDDDYGTVDEQKAFLSKLENGELEKDGGKREWAQQVTLVPPNPKAGVSSTKIRKAAKAQDWDEVSRLTTPGVFEWVRWEEPYGEDDRGAKMA